MAGQSRSGAPGPLDWLVFSLVPIFFSTNIIFGRGIIDDVAPYTTAFLRWAGSALIMLPFVIGDRQAAASFARKHLWLWLALGALGMGVCGGVVYWALIHTTAANGTLIYATSPLFIILFQWLIDGRSVSGRELAGMALAFSGVVAIVLRGDPANVTQLGLNVGDMGILAAALAFAAYSILLKRPALQGLRPLSLFGMIAFSGAIVLMPPSLIEVASGGNVPDSGSDWWKIAGIIAFASIAAFFCFQRTVQVFGPSTAGITIYLMPPVSIVMAVAFLGETFEPYHALGIVLVLGGVILASRGGISGSPNGTKMDRQDPIS
jgi:drug/metabolite transporter (DMT)-like permease